MASPVWCAEFGSNFREGRDCTIGIEDAEPSDVEAMLKYAYSGELDDASLASLVLPLAHRWERPVDSALPKSYQPTMQHRYAFPMPKREAIAHSGVCHGMAMHVLAKAMSCLGTCLGTAHAVVCHGICMAFHCMPYMPWHAVACTVAYHVNMQ